MELSKKKFWESFNCDVKSVLYFLTPLLKFFFQLAKISYFFTSNNLKKSNNI